MENIVEPDRSQMTVWSVRIAYWKLMGTNNNLEYVTFIALLLQIWLHKCNSLLGDTYLACLVLKIKQKGKLV